MAITPARSSGEILYNNPTYKCYLTRRWKELNATNGSLNYFTITERMEQLTGIISEAMVRENQRWGTIPDQSGEINKMKEWLQDRINWINIRLNNFSSCANVVVPQLVISKINYHPVPVHDYLSDDLEFIEITNIGFHAMNLTGVYFSQLGISYQFPANSTIDAGKKLILAGNSNAFEQFYGSIPFGEFTRNLSNKSEKIVLADAFGNIIDSVRYLDSSPWPVDADGGGYFLKLTDVKSDNSLVSNWIISSNLSVGLKNNPLETVVNIYPNPAQSEITVDGNREQFRSFEIFDINGRKMMAIIVSTNHFTIDIEKLTPGIFILKLQCNDGESFVRKFSKM